MTNPDFPHSLDPVDWDELRRDGHRMLDDMFDHLQSLRDQPVWRAPSARQADRNSRTPAARAHPLAPTCMRNSCSSILPYSSGNAHPGFMGWVQGGGTPVGMLAEMLAAGMNANLGGRDHMAIEVERQMIAWTRDLFGFPSTASGLFVTGTSAANFMGVLVARTRALGPPVRDRGLAAIGPPADRLHLRGGAWLHRSRDGDGGTWPGPASAHSGGRRTPDPDSRALAQAIANDRANGLQPFLLIGTAGTVDVGAIDDLAALADYRSGGASPFPHRWRLRGAGHARAGTRAAARRDRAGRTRWRSIGINGARCLTMPASCWCATALAPPDVRRRRCLSAPGRARAGRRRLVALRLRPRPCRAGSAR